MEALFLLTYSSIIWLIYFKFKLLPWNNLNKVIVFTIPVVNMAALILFLNVLAPSTQDVRIMNRHIEVIPAVSGRVIDVPVQENTLVQKGDTLLVIDPTPYKIRIKKISAAIEQAEASLISQNYQLKAVRKQSESIIANLQLAKKRVEEFRVLVEAKAGNKFDLESAETKVNDLEAKLNASRAQENQILTQITTEFEGEQVSIANLKTDLAKANWDLDNSVYTAPSNGYVTNLQLRVGSWLTTMPFKPAMTFIEEERYIGATFDQNELHQVEEGNEVELTLRAVPGKIFKCRVESIIWQQGLGRGQMTTTGLMPDTKPLPPGRYAVRFTLPEDEEFLRNGSVGEAAVYATEIHPVNIVRKVMIRMSSKINYLVLKLH
ncbi:HlyD family secretion protein [Sediminitomix flava]|uniref:Multidrug resistance efflux pump n=1 Tax=Sediminitomix flava TaxID=379075 RepID=A0A315ZHT0_SEDFL|nr:biotin/lipoyl-binding protein [Sediminitomix flava]PWJ45091.1 multidrug resistance efflux pump [Sediminitomix flava]